MESGIERGVEQTPKELPGKDTQDRQDEGVARKVVERFRKAASVEAKEREIWNRAYEYTNNRVSGELGQWEKNVRTSLNGKPALTIPVVRKFVNRLSGAQRLTKIDEKAFPVDDTADPVTAEILSDLIHYVYQINDADDEIAQMFRSGVITGRGWLKVEFTDENDPLGEISVRCVHPRRVYIYGRGYRYDLKDIVSLLERIPMSEEELEASYPDQYEKIVGMKNTAENEPPVATRNDYDFRSLPSDFYNDETKEYFVLREQRWDWEEEEYIKSPEGKLIPVKEGVELPKEIKTIKKRIRRVKITTVCGDTLLSQEYSDTNEFDLIPFFPYFDDGLSTGIVQDLLDAQDERNKRRSQMTHILGMIAKGNYFVKETAFDDVEEAKKLIGGTGNFIAVKGNVPIRDAIQPVQVDVTLFPTLASMEQMSHQEMKDVSGIQDAALGAIPDGVKSGVAIQSLQMPVEAIMGEMVENYLRTRKMVARRVIGLIQRYYDKEQRVRILGDYSSSFVPQEVQQIYEQLKRQVQSVNPFLDDAQAGDMAGQMIDIQNGAKVVTINKVLGEKRLLDVTAGKYDIVIDHVSHNPSTRRALLFDLLNLRSQGIPIPNKTLLEYSDIKNKQKVIAEMENEQAALAQQMAQEQMMRGMQKMGNPFEQNGGLNIAGGQLPMA